MTEILVPDGERIAYAHLTADPDVAALNTRFVGRTPKDTGPPWTRISLLDERPVAANIDHAVTVMLQLDVYAGSQADVLTHARTIRAALDAMPGAALEGGVVNDLTISGMARIPDTDFQPARERVILTVELTVRPA